MESRRCVVMVRPRGCLVALSCLRDQNYKELYGLGSVDYAAQAGADSPLVIQRGSPNQLTYDVGATYSFNMRQWWWAEPPLVRETSEMSAAPNRKLRDSISPDETRLSGLPLIAAGKVGADAFHSKPIIKLHRGGCTFRPRGLRLGVVDV